MNECCKIMENQIILKTSEIIVHNQANWVEELEGTQGPSTEGHTAPLPIQHFYIFSLLWQFAFNAAVTVMLRFMKYLVRSLGVAFQCHGLQDAANSIPICLHSVYKNLGISGDGFISYVACPRCHSVYCLEDCRFGKIESKKCLPYFLH